MRTLLHMPLDPACRLIRIILSEKGLVAQFEAILPWDEHEAISHHNPAGTIPVLLDEPPSGGQVAISPVMAIVEYLDEAYQLAPTLPGTSAARAETRRLCAWFMEKFEQEVSAFTIRERIDKRIKRQGQPDYDRLKYGLDRLSWHLDYMAWLLEQRSWIAGEKITVADFAAAAQLSVLDYIDAIQWEKFPAVKEWYARIKSRPSMRPLLGDRLDGLPPPSHYNDPDF